MKKNVLFPVICILSACLLFTAGCSSHNKNAPAESSEADLTDDLSETAETPTPADVPAEPVMTPVIVADTPSEQSSDPDDENVPEFNPDTVSEESPEKTDEIVSASDDEQPPAGIFTSSEISEELKMRINGKSYADGCTIPYEDLRYLQLSYVDFNGNTQVGEMICNKAIAADLLDIFSELYHNGYQIDKIRLIDDYNADDDASCDDDNTSCFNYRVVAGSTNLSKHAQGVAVDINPFYNPYVTYPDGKIRISPVGSESYADRSSDFPHKIDENDLAYKLFTKHGFAWGGHWKTLKDYQHFQKPLK